MHHENGETVGKQSRSGTDVFRDWRQDIGPAEAGSQLYTYTNKADNAVVG